MINCNQNIKRLLFYTTKTPLEKIGVNTNDESIEQPDIETDFVHGMPRIHSHFQDTILNELQTHIFVRRWKGNLSDKVIGDNMITVDIIVPLIYLELNDEFDRDSLIATEICDLVDNERIQSLGKIKVVQFVESNELKNKAFNTFTLFIEVPTSNAKVGK